MTRDEALNLIDWVAKDFEIADKFLQLIGCNRTAIIAYRKRVALNCLRSGKSKSDVVRILMRRFSISRRSAYSIIEEVIDEYI